VEEIGFLLEERGPRQIMGVEFSTDIERDGKPPSTPNVSGKRLRRRRRGGAPRLWGNGYIQLVTSSPLKVRGRLTQLPGEKKPPSKRK